DFLKSLDDYLLACFQTVRHDDHLTKGRSNFYGADLCFSVRPPPPYLVAALQLRHGLLRNQQCVRNGSDLGPRRRVLSGSQRELGIREAHCYLNGPSLWIDLAIYESEFSFMRVNAAVRQDQFHLIRTFGFRHRHPLLQSVGKLPIALFANREITPDRLDLGYRGQNRIGAGANQVPNL